MTSKATLQRTLSIIGLTGFLSLTATAEVAGQRETAADPEIPAHVNLARQYGWTPLHWAARHGQDRVIQRLIDEGATIDAREHLDRTPLHLAAMAGHRDAVERLLRHGANANARDRWNVTPLRRLELLTQARGWDRSDIKNLLEDSGGSR